MDRLLKVFLPRLGEFLDFVGIFVKTGFISCTRISLFLGRIAGAVTATFTGDILRAVFFLFFLDVLLSFCCIFESFSLSLRLRD